MTDHVHSRQRQDRAAIDGTLRTEEANRREHLRTHSVDDILETIGELRAELAARPTDALGGAHR